MNAKEWARTVEGLAAERGATYEPVGGLNPRGGPPTLCPGGTNRIKGELASGFWGASCDADEHESGGLFSKSVLPQAILAKAHMPDLARVVPIFNVESVEPGERVEQLTSRRKVEFESHRLQPPLPRHGPRRPRPGRAAGAVQPRLPRLGGADPQPGRVRDHRSPALLQLAPERAQRRRVRGCARPRRGPVRAPAQRDGRARPAHLSAGALARGPGIVSRRCQMSDPTHPRTRMTHGCRRWIGVIGLARSHGYGLRPASPAQLGPARPRAHAGMGSII